MYSKINTSTVFMVNRNDKDTKRLQTLAFSPQLMHSIALEPFTEFVLSWKVTSYTNVLIIIATSHRNRISRAQCL